MLVFQLLFAVAIVNPETLADQVRRQGGTDVRIERVQMDGDAPLEAIVRYELPDSGVHAVVLDATGGEWQTAGHFNSWWEYTKADGEGFLEFRETVAAGIFDVIVRTRSGGTEESRTALEIWRMRGGRLESVLELTEQESAMSHPSGEVSVTVRKLSFIPGRIMVRAVKAPGDHTSCEAFGWSESSFRFIPQPCT